METDEKSRTDHCRDRNTPLIPARMLNEFVYCPRPAYMMWVQGEFAHNGYTVEGKIQHRRVDKKTGLVLAGIFAFAGVDRFPGLPAPASLKRATLGEKRDLRIKTQNPH